MALFLQHVRCASSLAPAYYAIKLLDACIHNNATFRGKINNTGAPSERKERVISLEETRKVPGLLSSFRLSYDNNKSPTQVLLVSQPDKEPAAECYSEGVVRSLFVQRALWFEMHVRLIPQHTQSKTIWEANGAARAENRAMPSG